MKVTGAEILMKSLLQEKVEVIFGYPGGANMPIYDALYFYEKKLRHILVRHEQGAAHAAEGYARITGKPGVCLVTSGPGATNLVTGIADAMMDSVPLVCITGQVAAEFLGSDAFQEADVVGITTPITKWNCQLTHAEEIPEAVAKAFYIASHGRPGPVVIDITKNAQFEKVEFKYPKNFYVKKLKIVNKFNNRDIKKAAGIINWAKKPLMLVWRAWTWAPTARCKPLCSGTRAVGLSKAPKPEKTAIPSSTLTTTQTTARRPHFGN